MKKTYWLVLLFALVLNCTQAQSPKTKTQKMKNLHSYMLSGKTLTLKVGQKARLRMSVHGSVGITADVYSNDDDIVKFVETQTKYKDKKHEELDGADEATKTYIFEAVKAGETIIYAEEGFRGDVTSKRPIKIKVVDK